MKVYKANCFTAIYPFGIIAKGEILNERHLKALDEEALGDLTRRGVISVIDLAPEDGADRADETGTQAPGNEAEAPEDTEGTDEADTGGEGDEDEAEEIDLAAMDAVLGEEPTVESPEEAPAPKPARSRKKAAKPDKGGEQQ